MVKRYLWIVATGLLALDAQGGTQYQFLNSFSKYTPEEGATPSSVFIGTDLTIYGATMSGGLNNHGIVFRLNRDGSGYQMLHDFEGPDGDVINDLIQASDGKLYGISWDGGVNGAGVIFKLNTNGTGFELLHEFASNNIDGALGASLIEAQNGFLYGTTQAGGINGNSGTIFKISKDGNDYALLHNLAGSTSDGRLLEASDGFLYGATVVGGSNGAGVLYKIDATGNAYQILHHFGGTNGDGVSPNNGLAEGIDGMLYGTSRSSYRGLFAVGGNIFKLGKNGTNYAVICNTFLHTNDSGAPSGALVPWDDGKLYSVSSAGGTYGGGTIFSFDTNNNTYATVNSFGNLPSDGTAPTRLIRGGDGFLYGITTHGPFWGNLFKFDPATSNYAILHSFIGGQGGGFLNWAGVIEGSDGELYGTTAIGGGIYNNLGVVYTARKDGSNLRVLHSFSNAGQDGVGPKGRLLRGMDGFLYGTTFFGGYNASGTLFKLSTNGSDYRVIYGFGPSNQPFSAYPASVLCQAPDGTLYGTSELGGIGHGTAFKIDTNGSNFSIIHQFGALAGDGSQPDAGLTFGSDGWLYGISYYGGTNNVGTIYKLDTNGGGYAVLHTFTTNSTDGYYPEGELLEASDGWLYGQAYQGGSNNWGIVYKITKLGTDYTILHYFKSGPQEGSSPSGSLVEGMDGALYGTTEGGGTNLGGTFFKINKDGTGYAVLYSFKATPTDAQQPASGVTLASDGVFYGTTVSGGGFGQGALFRIWPPQTPELTGITKEGDSLLAAFAGTSGFHYQIQRSSNLLTWSVLSNISMPQSGVFTNVDTTPPQPSAFYRAVWIAK